MITWPEKWWISASKLRKWLWRQIDGKLMANWWQIEGKLITHLQIDLTSVTVNFRNFGGFLAYTKVSKWVYSKWMYWDFSKRCVLCKTRVRTQIKKWLYVGKYIGEENCCCAHRQYLSRAAEVFEIPSLWKEFPPSSFTPFPHWAAWSNLSNLCEGEIHDIRIQCSFPIEWRGLLDNRCRRRSERASDRGLGSGVGKECVDIDGLRLRGSSWILNSETMWNSKKKKQNHLVKTPQPLRLVHLKSAQRLPASCAVAEHEAQKFLGPWPWAATSA